ncbi:MAG TPA: basic secretory protein-like protein [Tepidisphaeraceae bacterium]|jgi:hypothetical protein
MRIQTIAAWVVVLGSLPAWAAEPEKPAAPASAKDAPAAREKGSEDKPQNSPPVTPENFKFVIKVDTSDVPEMADYGKRVQKVAEEWYPKIWAKLPSEGFVPPATVTITFKKDYKGVAAASGNRITAAQKWFTDHPDDVGAFVHELVHVVQAYRRGPKPGWLVEGIADWYRFFNYEPVNKRPHPNPTRAKYTDSYRTTGHFLNWAQETYDKDLVVKINAACRQGKYNEGLWKEYTGKTLEELGAEWKESLAKK